MASQRKRTRKQANQSKHEEDGIVQKTYQERALENAVFGTTDISIFGKEKQHHNEKLALQQDRARSSNDAPVSEDDDLDDLFVIDTKGNTEEAEPDTYTSESSIFQEEEDAPAWIDENDVNVKIDLSSSTRLRKLRRSDTETVITGDEYVKRLKSVYENLNYSQKWAKAKPILEDDEQSSSLEARGRAIFNTDSDFSNSTTLQNPNIDRPLPSGRLQVLPLKDANLASPSQGVIHALQWHPNSQLLMTAGMDRMVKLFSIDGVRNPKVQGLLFVDLPIRSAAFINNGDEIIATGRRSYFYSVDVRSGTVRRVPSIRGRTEKSWEFLAAPPAASGSDLLALLGSNGYIVLISSKTKQLIGTMMTNSTVRSASFSADGQTLTTIGDDGEIFVWDSRSRACRFRKPDVSGINGTAIAVSPNSQFLATGGNSGVVNVYAGKDLNLSADIKPLPALLRSPLKPLQSLFNLTTPVHSLTFNHDSSILAMSSEDLKDQLRLIHMPSLTAFSNWPTSRTPLHVVTSVTFSPNSGYIAIGNDRGRVLLYRLSHFQSV